MTLCIGKTTDDLVAEINKIASQRPDVKYFGLHDDNRIDKVRCSNTEGKCTDGTVGCIVGQGLINLGVPVSDLDMYSESAVADVAGVFLDYDPEELYDGNILWLEDVQALQDQGKTWGEAVAEATAKADVRDNQEWGEV